MFYARFNVPQLDFVCNHEALLELAVDEGHYNLDYAKASDSATADR